MKRLFESQTKQKVGCVVCVKRREESSYILQHQQAWIGKHLIKIHKLSKATTQDSSSQASQAESTTPGVKDNLQSQLTQSNIRILDLRLLHGWSKNISPSAKWRMRRSVSLLVDVLWEL